MKFHELPDGCRFEFEGEVYTKRGTLRACQERNGHLRVIRRSATVQVLEGGEPGTPPDEPAGNAAIRAAFEVFCGICDRCLEKMASAYGDTGNLAQARSELGDARKVFLDCLKRESG